MPYLPAASIVAKKFTAILKSWLSPSEWREMRKRNATAEYGGLPLICASHDFCDANMAMLEAFNKLGYRDPAGTDQGRARWGEAWRIAKKKYLTAARHGRY